MTTLREAIEHLYEIAVVQGKDTSTKRLDGLARYCAEQLECRGLEGVQTEAELPGVGRPKNWDVAWRYQDKYRLAVSLKSILRNVAGTVPNRLDDLMGEVANIQLYSPEIVTGYLMVFDRAQDRKPRQEGLWSQILKDRLEHLSRRSPPAWSIGMVEASAVIEVDFSQGPALFTAEAQIERMFDILVAEVRARNPSLTQT